jgi:hypothetical protein
MSIQGNTDFVGSIDNVVAEPVTAVPRGFSSDNTPAHFIHDTQTVNGGKLSAKVVINSNVDGIKTQPQPFTTKDGGRYKITFDIYPQGTGFTTISGQLRYGTDDGWLNNPVAISLAPDQWQTVSMLYNEMPKGGAGSYFTIYNSNSLAGELFTNTGFDTDTDWTKGDAAITIAAGVASWSGAQTGTASLYQNISETNGSYYRIRFTVSNRTAGGIKWMLNGNQTGDLETANGTYEYFVKNTTSTASRNAGVQADADFDGDIDDLQIEEVRIMYIDNVSVEESWVPIHTVHRNDLGTWKDDIHTGYCKVSGVWQKFYEVIVIPTGLIIPFNSATPPTGWTLFTTADTYYIVGAGSTYSVGASGAGTGGVTLTLNTTGDHLDGSAIANVATNGGRYRWYAGNPAVGNHGHTRTVTPTMPFQSSYLIKAGAGQTWLPAGGSILTDSYDYAGFHGLVNAYTDGYMLKAAASVATGGSLSIAAGGTNSAGSHNHGFSDSGDGSGSTAAIASGAHSHTVSGLITNGLKQRAMALWQNASAKFRLGQYMIGMYESLTPPTGWALCDGTNGTPDLRDYFIKPVAQASAGSSSGDGSLTFNLTAGLAHGSHNHNDSGDDGGTGGTAYHSNNRTMTAHTDPAHVASGWLPPYYALSFIMKT